MLGAVFAGIWGELRTIAWTGPRARFATATTLSVALAAVAAIALRVDDVWWAAISGFMSSQTTRPASVERAGLRIIGTFAGASVAVVAMPWVAEDHVACCLLVFVAASVGALGGMVSSRPYAWLFFGITADMVVLASLLDPPSAVHTAFYRTVEVAIGCSAAVLVATLYAGEGDAPAARPPVPGWSDLMGENWPKTRHAVRTGLAVMLMPLIWSWFDLPGLAQMAISTAAVMAVPVVSGRARDDQRMVLERAMQRLTGCCLGAVAGLLVLAWGVTNFVLWLLLLCAGVWTGAYVQTSSRNVGYVGTQAAVVFIMTLIQGFGPATSLLPGIQRFAGMLAGLLVLAVISLLVWPDDSEADL
jgi:uncharacterized membrane protein YccC